MALQHELLPKSELLVTQPPILNLVLNLILSLILGLILSLILILRVCRHCQWGSVLALELHKVATSHLVAGGGQA